jgi:hypothetical protein
MLTHYKWKDHAILSVDQNNIQKLSEKDLLYF